MTVCHVTAPRAALSRTLGSAPSGAGEPWRSAVEADERCHPLPHSHGGGAGLVLVIPPSEGERGCLAVDAWNPGPSGVLAQALRPPGQVTPILRCWVSCGQAGDSCPGIACCPAGPGWSSRFTACIPASCSGPLRALPCPPVPAQPACRRCWECGGKQSQRQSPAPPTSGAASPGAGDKGWGGGILYHGLPRRAQARSPLPSICFQPEAVPGLPPHPTPAPGGRRGWELMKSCPAGCRFSLPRPSSLSPPLPRPRLRDCGQF